MLVLRGESTKRIAFQLRLSAYTVQDHLDNACEKMGVRGRKALLAKLLMDGYAAQVAEATHSSLSENAFPLFAAAAPG